MEATHKYDSLLDSAPEISDITTDEQCARILQRLKNNDTRLKVLDLFGWAEDEDNYDPVNGHDLGWLGYYIGRSKKLKYLNIINNIQTQEDVILTKDEIDFFLQGLCQNQSIERFHIGSAPLDGGVRLHDGDCRLRLQDIEPLLKNNAKLCFVRLDDSTLSRETVGLLSADNLKVICLSNIEMDDETFGQALRTFGALSHLTELGLYSCNISKERCVEVADFLHYANPDLTCVDLQSNLINSFGVEVLASAISVTKNIRILDLSYNSGITMSGWQALSSLMRSPDSTLEKLRLRETGIDDEVAAMFASALARNKTLTTLEIMGNGNIGASGWAAISQLLCDTSSVNKTYLSNHTLCNLGRCGQGEHLDNDISFLLRLNEDSRNKCGCFFKIIQSHPDINMQPLFEWKFKALPLLIEWFDRVHRSFGWSLSGWSLRTIHIDGVKYNASPLQLPKIKLSGIYQFIRGMPTAYIEVWLLHELNEIRAAKKRLQLREHQYMNALQYREAAL